MNKISVEFAKYLTVAAMLVSSVVLWAQEDEEDEAQEEVAAVKMEKKDVELGAPFCDNAVLQQGVEVPVWGWSKPGTKVTVEFGGQKVEATAGADGKWMVKLGKLKASFEPREMVIQESGVRGQESGKRVVLKNILVGEVWMASGQSNMQWKVPKSSSNNLKVEPVDGVNPIREFEVTSAYGHLHPIEKAEGSWKDGDYSGYSAIAFAFAHKLYEELKVPIGILNCSFSQTAIQAWVPREGFATGDDEYTRAIHQRCLQTDPRTPEHKAAWAAFYKSLEDQIKANDERIKKGEEPLQVAADLPGNMSGNRDANWMFNGRLNPVVPYAIRGAIWNQGYANMGEGLPYYNNLHSLIRGWRLVWNQPNLPVYFHQFYTPGKTHKPSIGSTSEMRLGTWLARDIPNAGMASQIDISGGIHYYNKAVPGQRLALHALKNQYNKKVEADGPMFKSYKVKGDKVIVEFEHADGGIVVADTAFNRSKADGATGFAEPKVIENGEDKVELFWLAGEDRVWHPASVKIDGDKVVVTSPAVKEPRGVSYGSGGIGFQPCLYNKALLPMTPFIYYDNELVKSEMWPDGKLKIAGETIDPSSVGKLYEYRKMPLLSTQFRDNSVLQADKPVTIWGSVRNFGEWQDKPESGKCEVNFEFGDIKKTIPVTPDMREWQVTLPVMKASTKGSTLKVNFTIDGEVVHERTSTNIVFGDVWFVAAPAGKLDIPEVKPSGQIVRMIENQSKRDSNPNPSRFSVCVSRTPAPDNRFASYWKEAEGFAGAIGHSIAAETKRPVGVIFMQSKGSGKGKAAVDTSTIAQWMAPDFLKEAPSLMEDYKSVGSMYPGNPYYNANIKNYIEAWQKYWGEYIPEMIKTGSAPDGKSWGTYPSKTASAGSSTATHIYNTMVHSFTPAALKGVVFLASPSMVAGDQGANFGSEMAALAKSFKSRLGGDPNFIYTVPAKALAPKITAPKKIEGKSVAVEVADWADVTKVIEAAVK